MNTPLTDWLRAHLVCPRDHGALTQTGQALGCAQGHRYPIVEGIPVMLLDDVEQTFAVAHASLAAGRGERPDEAGELYLDSVSLSDAEKAGVRELAARQTWIDPVVAYLIAATNGLMYRHLVGRLESYPIPTIDLPPGGGRTLLDVGCGWGRWSIAATRRDYQAVGIDPSLGAVLSARRVAAQLGVAHHYVVGDARFLPFAVGTFDVAYSYSVLQHLSEQDTEKAVAEIGRVLRPGGRAKVQMPTRFGIRCLYHQFRRGFREAREFEVRYRTLPQLRQLFEPHVGPVRFEADCYFGIGLQTADAHLMTAPLRTITGASEGVKRAGRRLPALTWVADSVFVESVSRA